MYYDFFDIPLNALPQNCDYYFNVFVITVGIPVGLFNTIYEVYDISKITAARPIMIEFFEDEEIDDDLCHYEFFPNSVVEVNRKTREVSWYAAAGI